MVDRKEKRKPRGRYCVAGAPNQQSCQNTTFMPGIQMYQFPSDPARSSEIGPVCPKTPTQLQGSDIKIGFAMFGTF